MTVRIDPPRRSIIRFILTESIFATLLYFAIVQGVVGAERVAVAWAWFGAVISLVLLNDDAVREYRSNGKPATSLKVSASIDFVFIGFMFWHGWIATPIAYIFSVMLSARLYHDPDQTKRDGSSTEAKP